ncbi:cobalt-zinc-cadmium efflux system membrane fusion protein [Arcticibacter tournemirensis]|uniref:Efflux RND transporter periplasmic adaptor subunit n=1 Tax=Arcticibacter tournemirensis TaxID=699437 RepID=A0A5M9HAW8_9SPHI|nr:efflux RND transporter periplasmic adaptor subunit [Arcticibacter tournemirensis]KAA8483810.1 efflux RND transporter periplasmic adaptor subunit [Arcticibacter tournemirensis]TQM49984.1 cobalt-zinc-cadmium efflux system membrane fusion protein [Arcticibacter tournemirensis]
MTVLKRKLKSILFFLCSLLVLGCGGNEQPTDDAEKESEETATREGIQLSQRQIDAVNIQLGPIEEKNLKSVVKASGQLEVPPQNKAEVTLLTGGVVKQIFVLEGSHVYKGQKLAAIESNEIISLQQEYLTALNELNYAKKEFTRQKELNENNAGTGKVLQQAEAAYHGDEARTAALARRLQQAGVNPSVTAKGKLTSLVPVYSPLGGTISKISIETGSYAEAARSLMNVIDNSKVHCDLLVYEKDLFKVKEGQTVTFLLTNQNNREITGKIYGVNQSFENDSKAIIAHAVIENAAKSNLIQGMYVSALIETGSHTTPAVPTESIVRSGGKEYIYYLKKVEKEAGSAKDKDQKTPADAVYYFDKAEVISGVSDLGYTEIKLITPVPKDVRIVTKGAFYILSSTEAEGEEE